MNAFRHVLLLTAAFGLASPVSASGEDAPKSETYDVVIYGGTSAGIIATAQATKMKKSVVLIEPSTHLGGLTTGGLGWTDSGNKAVIGGMSRDFYKVVKKHYDDPANWKHEDRAKYSRYRPDDEAMWTFEPHVASEIMRAFLAACAVEPIVGVPLATENAVEKDGTTIRAITLADGRTFRGRVFLDCTYEGDLLAAAGISYAVGRESNEKYGETLNGVGTRWNTHLHRFVKPVDPYVTPGDPKSGLLPGIDPDGPGEEGAGDHRVQAYNYRLCITDAKENRVPFAKPEGYDEGQYELLFRNFEAGDHRLPLKIDMMPNRKTDVNNQAAVSTDYIGMNYEYPDGDANTRQKILDAHETYIRGLMWALANHSRVPDKIRAKMSQWGWAADEYTDNAHFPPQIYVREARRMIGDYVMTEHDCRRTRKTPASVGMGSYNMDSHNVQRYVTKDGHVQNEGDVQESPRGAYQISYRAITPKRDECTNLLAPVAVSASHAAYGSIRMEPVFMILGQSAATAAAFAIEDGTTVQDVPYEKLSKRLLQDGQVLEYDSPTPGNVQRLTGLKGIVLDDSDAEKTGEWKASTSTGPIYGASYLHDDDSQKGKKQIVFTPDLKELGEYEIRLLYTVNPNRATNVPVSIKTGREIERFTINQRKPVKPIRLLLAAGKQTTITVETTGTDGYVIVDGVQLVPVASRE